MSNFIFIILIFSFNCFGKGRPSNVDRIVKITYEDILKIAGARDKKGKLIRGYDNFNLKVHHEDLSDHHFKITLNNNYYSEYIFSSNYLEVGFHKDNKGDLLKIFQDSAFIYGLKMEIGEDVIIRKNRVIIKSQLHSADLVKIFAAMHFTNGKVISYLKLRYHIKQ